MITPTQIKQILEENIEGCTAQVLDPMNDGVHLSATIVSASFEGQNRVAQHRAVNAILKAYFDDGSLHALQFKTLTPAQAEKLSKS